VDNSIKHGGAELREIEIGCREEKDHHVVSFRDDGVGIKEMGSNKIFDRFERQESARQRDGSGLGLAIVKEIVERHNGWIRLETHTHKGTLFHFAISKDPIVSQSSTPNSSLKGDR
jgi:signal transduction histidine kinase